MYEYISGNIAECTPTYAVVEASGVGYLLNISLHTYSAIEHSTAQVKLFTHYIVREDAQILYGFSTKIERDMFRLLISVSGVGGNTARMILSTYSVDELQSIISTANATLLKNVKGLGLKTAQKIIVDLSGKMTLGSGDEPSTRGNAAAQEAYQQAQEALLMLGFNKSAIEKAIAKIHKDSSVAAVEDIIRAALKIL